MSSETTVSLVGLGTGVGERRGAGGEGITRTTTFPHKTSPAISSSTTHINTNTPAINDAPVELPADSATILSPNFASDGAKRDDLRKEMLATRSKDPGVIVDVPQEPTAEEVQASRLGEGVVTPGMRG